MSVSRPVSRDRRSQDRGQTLAEFAITAPILFLLLFGVIQVGLLMASQNGLVNGVRDSTRRAATYRVNDQSLTGAIFGAVCDAVEEELSKRLHKEMPGFIDDPARLDTTIVYEWNPDPTTGEYSLIANITVEYDAPLFIPLVGILLNPPNPDTFPLRASEQMRIENPPIAPTDISPQEC
jgi:Flp pilus assembly protein TadG